MVGAGDLEISIPEDILEGFGDELVPATREDVRYDELVREVIPLKMEDLKALELLGPSKSQSGLQHLRTYHHNIALRLAAGEKPIEICAALSLTPQTITRLMKSSQFMGLVEAYRDKVVSKVVDAAELMSIVNAETLTAIHEKLISNERGEIPLEMLRRIFVDTADRTGHSPIRRSETLARHQHELSDATIEHIKKLHGENTAYSAPTIEATFQRVHEEESANSGAATSIAGAFKPAQEKAPNGKPRSGNGIPAKGCQISADGTLVDSEGRPI